MNTKEMALENRAKLIGLVFLCAFLLIWGNLPLASAHQAYDYQATILHNKNLPFNWYPQQEEKVVMAVDKTLWEKELQGWQDFYNSSAVLGIDTDMADYAYSLFAFTQGMGKEPTTQETARLLQKLWQNNRLMIIDNEMEYIKGSTYRSLGRFPVEFMFLSRALAEKKAGRDLQIIVPKEGTLSLTKGEITNKELPQYKAAVPTTQFAEPELLNSYISNCSKTIRREILHIRYFVGADGYEHFVSYLFLLLLIIFTFGYLQPKITRPVFKNALTYLEVGLLFFAVIRIIKLETPSTNVLLLRYLWYAYYPAFFVIGLACLLLAYYTGSPIGEKKFPVWWQGLCWLDILLTFIIFTNDIHGAFASLPPDLAYTDSFYKAGFLNLPIKLVAAGEFMAVPFILIKNNVRSKFTSFKIILPLTVYVGELIIQLCYNLHLWGAQNLEIVLVTILGVLLFILAAVYAGIFPTNRGYRTAFTYSTASMLICDSTGATIFDSVTKIPPDKNMRLHIMPLAAGRLYWQENVKEINLLRRSLALNNAALTRYNNLLQKKKAVRSHLVELELREKMFKELEVIIGFKKAKMQLLVAKLQGKTLSEEKRNFYIQLLSCFVVYIKKRSILLLSSEAHNRLITPEFRAALEESCEFYQKAGLSTGCSFNITSESLAAFDAMLVYDLAELVWEESAKEPHGDLLVSIAEEHGKLKIIIKAQGQLCSALEAAMDLLSNKQSFMEHNFVLTKEVDISTLTMLPKEEVPLYE